MKRHRKHKRQLQEPVLQNPVAKHAHKFNRAQVFKDKTKYQRKIKHKGREPFIMSFKKGMTKGFKSFAEGLFRASAAC